MYTSLQRHYHAVLRAGRYNRLAAPSLDRNRRALYPMPEGTREPVTIAGRPWERVWRDDGTYECVPVPDEHAPLTP